MKKALRLNIILMLAVLLAFNSFAWFVYSTRVATSISTRVRAWRVNFEQGENEVAEYINFEIESLYPGMPDFSDVITIANHGETEVIIEFKIISFRILDLEYDDENYTHEQMEDALANEFPFSITFDLENDTLEPESGETDFDFFVTWPFESGDDEADTYWGSEAYTFHQENPGVTGVIIEIRLSAIQNN